MAVEDPEVPEPRARVSGPDEVNLGLRKRPTQARGELTFNAILDATARLLDEVAPEGISTNLVAQRAGVNISTLYQYFPNKDSILLALFERDTRNRLERVRAAMEGLGESPDWRTRIASIIDENVAARRRQPGAAPLRRSMRASPELQRYQREMMLALADTLGAELVRPGRTDAESAGIAALCAMESYAALLDLWAFGYAAEVGVADDRVIDEAKRMAWAHLGPFLDP